MAFQHSSKQPSTDSIRGGGQGSDVCLPLRQEERDCSVEGDKCTQASGPGAVEGATSRVGERTTPSTLSPSPAQHTGCRKLLDSGVALDNATTIIDGVGSRSNTNRDCTETVTRRFSTANDDRRENHHPEEITDHLDNPKPRSEKDTSADTDTCLGFLQQSLRAGEISANSPDRERPQKYLQLDVPDFSETTADAVHSQDWSERDTETAAYYDQLMASILDDDDASTIVDIDNNYPSNNGSGNEEQGYTEDVFVGNGFKVVLADREVQIDVCSLDKGLVKENGGKKAIRHRYHWDDEDTRGPGNSILRGLLEEGESYGPDQQARSELAVHPIFRSVFCDQDDNSHRSLALHGYQAGNEDDDDNDRSGDLALSIVTEGHGVASHAWPDEPFHLLDDALRCREDDNSRRPREAEKGLWPSRQGGAQPSIGREERARQGWDGNASEEEDRPIDVEESGSTADEGRCDVGPPHPLTDHANSTAEEREQLLQFQFRHSKVGERLSLTLLPYTGTVPGTISLDVLRRHEEWLTTRLTGHTALARPEELPDERAILRMKMALQQWTAEAEWTCALFNRRDQSQKGRDDQR